MKGIDDEQWWILNNVFVVKFACPAVSKNHCFHFKSTRANVLWIINKCQPDIFPVSRFLTSLVNCLKTNALIFAAKIVVSHEEKYACLNCHNKLYNSYDHSQLVRVLLVADCSRSRQWRYVKIDFTYYRYHMLSKLNII